MTLNVFEETTQRQTLQRFASDVFAIFGMTSTNYRQL